jgi:hypothetical protein
MRNRYCRRPVDGSSAWSAESSRQIKSLGAASSSWMTGVATAHVYSNRAILLKANIWWGLSCLPIVVSRMLVAGSSTAKGGAIVTILMPTCKRHRRYRLNGGSVTWLDRDRLRCSAEGRHGFAVPLNSATSCCVHTWYKHHGI